MTNLRNVIILFVVSISSCTYNVEEELYASTECMINELSYQTDIVPILDANCYICHGIGVNQGGVTLEGYENLIPNINNGKILGVIKHENGFVAMPAGAPKLLDCEIQKIEQWVDDGAPNN